MKSIIVAASLMLALPAAAQNIITVAPSGGDFSDPASALNAIGSALPASSASNRYLVKVAPGVYTVGTPVEMKPFVDLEGSGIKTTVIRGAIGSDFTVPQSVQGIINAASRSEIRHLTVRNTWSATSAIGIVVDSTSGSAISNVRTVARGESSSSAAWKYGMRIENSTNTRLVHVSALGRTPDSASCIGVAIRNSLVSVSDSRLVGRDCTLALALTADDASVVRVNSSQLRGEGELNGISLSGASDSEGESTDIRVSHSSLEGNVLAGIPDELGATSVRITHSELNGSVTGSAACFSVHNASLTALSSTCIP